MGALNTALLVVTNGRDDLLRQTVESFDTMVSGNVIERWMFDDSGDDQHRRHLARRYPTFTIVGDGAALGYAGAMRRIWDTMPNSGADWIFHLEDDFTFNRPVDLADLAAVLQPRPRLLQMALKRQPVNEREIAAGGVVESRPEEYDDHHDEHGRQWLETTLWFTCNPCLYRRSLYGLAPWPGGRGSEARYTRNLIRATGGRCGYWGARTDPPLVEHIGAWRVGGGH